jgi:MarR family transcriptional regulator, 2-MHQ and catechol-resistance regulon repressor
MSTSRLQGELKKKRPFDLPEQEAMLNILRTSDQFQNRFGRLLREYGPTIETFFCHTHYMSTAVMESI